MKPIPQQHGSVLDMLAEATVLVLACITLSTAEASDIPEQLGNLSREYGRRKV